MPPAQKTAWSFDATTGIYTGETVADESPLEPGVFHLPRHSTDVEPPAEVAAGFAAFWRGDHWALEVVPAKDEDLDGIQDMPPGFEAEKTKPVLKKPGYFARLARAVVGK